jgi:hypothetical protein
VLSGKCYVTEEHDKEIVALVQETQPEMPLLVAMMTKPNLKPYPDLVHKVNRMNPREKMSTVFLFIAFRYIYL